MTEAQTQDIAHGVHEYLERADSHRESLQSDAKKFGQPQLIEVARPHTSREIVGRVTPVARGGMVGTSAIGAQSPATSRPVRNVLSCRELLLSFRTMLG